MLRIECYPVLDGVAITVTGVDSSRDLRYTGALPSRVQRTVPVETIESLGIDEAIRDTLVDIIVLYPGLLKHALS